MVRYNSAAISLFVAMAIVQSTAFPTLHPLSSSSTASYRRTSTPLLQAALSSAIFGRSSDGRDGSNIIISNNSGVNSYNDAEETIRNVFRSVTAQYLESLSFPPNEENEEQENEEEEERFGPVERMPKMVLERSAIAVQGESQAAVAVSADSNFSYVVSLPIVATSDTPAPNYIGMSLRQVYKGGNLSEGELDVDTLQIRSSSSDTVVDNNNNNDDDDTTKKEQLLSRTSNLDQDFVGLIVSSVMEGSAAWDAGVRVGDALSYTSATMGETLWPKSTLDGVRSAILSRKVMSKTMQFQFRRSGTYTAVSEVVEQFELSLTRPMGMQIEDSEDGYVRITGFTGDEADLSGVEKGALQVGDRIIAVDSSLGNKMWPVSNVDGLISAVTARLPGQQVRLRFERMVDVVLPQDVISEGASSSSTATKSSDASIQISEENQSIITEAAATTTTLETPIVTTTGSTTKTLQSGTSKTQTLLLSKCRDALRQYMEKTKKSPANTDVLVSVADRVLEALADASAPLDSRTLTLTMNAYNICQRPEKAILAFEAAVGLSADGSSTVPRDANIFGKKNPSKTLVSNIGALNIYSGTALLRAHALRGDCVSARRVLAAMENVGDVTVERIPSISWSQKIGEEIKVDARCYNIVLAAATKAGGGGQEAMEMASDIFKSMGESLRTRDPSLSLKKKPARNLVTYNTMIGAYANAGRAEDALDLYNSMKQAGIQPDKISYTSLIKAFVQSGRVNEGRDLLNEMTQERIIPDAVSYNTVIKALCNQYKWFEAKALVSDMEFYGIYPDSITYGLLMNGLLKAGKPGPCLTLFETACSDERSAPLMENVQLYTTAISAASKLGDDVRALGLVARMVSTGIKPNVKTFTALMNACLVSRKPNSALEVYQKIDEPDGFAMTLYIRALCGVGNFQSAAKLLTAQRDGEHEMSGKQVMASYNNIIQSSLQMRNYKVARDALTELLQSGYIPSKITYGSILEGLDILPKKKRAYAPMTTTGEIKEKEVTKFNFLLFVIDSLQLRNLSSAGSFYSSILFEGAKIGGLPKKICSLMSEARDHTNKKRNEKEGILANSGNDDDDDDMIRCLTWEELISNYSKYKGKLGGDLSCRPPMNVSVNQKNIRQVLAAEKAVSYYGGRGGRVARRR